MIPTNVLNKQDTYQLMYLLQNGEKVYRDADGSINRKVLNTVTLEFDFHTWMVCQGLKMSFPIIYDYILSTYDYLLRLEVSHDTDR